MLLASNIQHDLLMFIFYLCGTRLLSDLLIVHTLVKLSWVQKPGTSWHFLRLFASHHHCSADSLAKPRKVGKPERKQSVWNWGSCGEKAAKWQSCLFPKRQIHLKKAMTQKKKKITFIFPPTSSALWDSLFCPSTPCTYVTACITACLCRVGWGAGGGGKSCRREFPSRRRTSVWIHWCTYCICFNSLTRFLVMWH